MKRIVILRCLGSNNVCTGAACLKAFNKKTGAFARYGEEPLELEAYWSCNGCGDCHFIYQEGIEEKLERIINTKCSHPTASKYVHLLWNSSWPKPMNGS